MAKVKRAAGLAEALDSLDEHLAPLVTRRCDYGSIWRRDEKLALMLFVFLPPSLYEH